METSGFIKTGDSTLRIENDTAKDVIPNTAPSISPNFKPLTWVITTTGNSAKNAISTVPIDIGIMANISISEVITAISAISFVLWLIILFL